MTYLVRMNAVNMAILCNKIEIIAELVGAGIYIYIYIFFPSFPFLPYIAGGHVTVVGWHSTPCRVKVWPMPLPQAQFVPNIETLIILKNIKEERGELARYL